MEITQKQLQIVELTGRMLIQDGVNKLTIKNLANEMNFSESAIYRHFSSKEEIILTLLEMVDENINTYLSEEIKNKNTAAQNLVNVLKSQFAHFNKNRHFIIAILSESIFDESEAINNAILKIIASQTKVMTQLIDRGKISNEFNTGFTTQSLVHLLMGSFRLHILKWKLSNFNLNLEAEGTRQIEDFIKLIKAK